MATTDGSLVIAVDMNVDEATKEVDRLRKRILSLEGELEDKKYTKTALEEQFEQIGYKLEEIRAKAGGVLPKNDPQAQMLLSEWNRIDSEIIKTEQSIDNLNIALDVAKQRHTDVYNEAKRLNSVTVKMSGAVQRASQHWNRFSNRLKSIVAGAFVFNLLSSALRNLQTWMWNTVTANEDARAAIARLKAALLTLAQPLVNVLIPAFVTLVNVITSLVNAISRAVSRIFGVSFADSAKQAKKAAAGYSAEAGAIGSVGDAAEEAAGSLASFDEINTIQTENESSSAGSGGGGGGGLGGGVSPDFTGLIDSQVNAIVELFAGVGLLALGAILTFSGANIPLGLGLMVLGAFFIADAIMTNWDAISQALQGPLGALMAILGTAFLVIGAILAFSGVNIPLGIALMAIGAFSLATVVAANWDTISEALQGPIGTVVAIISAQLLMIGVILLFSGVAIPLGLGLLAVGAAGLGTTIAANWNTIQHALQGPIRNVVSALSGALLVLGAILAFSGAALPLGLGLMVAGAAGLAMTIAANWSTISQALRGPIGLVTAIVSGALLALGVVLLFTGAGIPLGLGLIAAGAAGLAVSIAPNWGFILEKVKGIWRDITSWWNGNAAKFLTWEYWSNLGKNMIEGLLEGLRGIFSGLSSWASDVWSTITGVFSRNNAKSSISSRSGTSSRMSQISVSDIPPIANFNPPALARGAVIPPNREFMAVLGDQRNGNNIEAPESLIRQIVREETAGSSALLSQILSAIREGKVLVVDRQVLARVAVRGINDLTMQAGHSVLKI